MTANRAVPLLTGHSTQRTWTWRDPLSWTTAQLQQAMQMLSSCNITSFQERTKSVCAQLKSAAASVNHEVAENEKSLESDESG